MKLSLSIISVIVLLSGCVPLSENPKYLFSNGIYQVRTGKQKQSSYLRINEDVIRQYSTKNAGKYDTAHYAIILIRDSLGIKPVNYSFTKYSLDIDLISIPLKFRSAVSGFPAQLNATINGGLFVGRHADIYRLRKSFDPLGLPISSIQHYGVSFGA